MKGNLLIFTIINSSVLFYMYFASDSVMGLGVFIS